ncbi:MAG: amino acid ABC transporter permease [Erysipelotrichaceae bacterium]|nr:amino acid ABC transporter permease [Erysipelotrichaceae bacterium]MBQ1810872.1 amino acid ABC transporter permease [Erysipelotrichaceae bacterium]
MSLQRCIEIFLKYLPSFLLGIRTTLVLSLAGTLIGLLLGLLVGGLKAIRIDENASSLLKFLKKLFNILATVYIEIFRGTPMMVQAVFIYYLVYMNIFPWDKFVAALFVISVNTGAYMSEIIRSGIQSVDRGQTEAARALGFTNMQTMFDVVLPQAVKNAFPAIGNEFIVNIKDSSVLMIISITELMFQSSSIAGTTYRFTETYFVTACVYLLLTMVTSVILHIVENRMSHTNTSIPQSDTDPSNMKLARGK